MSAVHPHIEAVVIGGSAGGVEALNVLLPKLPADLKPPVFAVLHLLRERPSLLVEIFEPKCQLAVRQATDKERIAAGTIYFAPPNYHLLVDRDAAGAPQLALSIDEPVHYSRPSIDVLFESAADVYSDRLLGIILSGANEDGADGLDAIHRAGGMTVVQAPEDARSPQMVMYALQRTAADLVLPLDQIAELLSGLPRQTS